MSDYQSVTVKAVEARVVTLEVVEDDPDMDALSSIIENGSLRTDAGEGALKVAAELVLERNGCRNVLCAHALKVRERTGSFPGPREFVSGLELVSAKSIGTSNADRPRFQAVLRVTLARDEYARDFSLGEQWGAVATPVECNVSLIDFWEHAF